MKITKDRYLQSFGIVVLLLALVRCIFPSVADRQDGKDVAVSDSVMTDSLSHMKDIQAVAKPLDKPSRFFDNEGKPVKHPIYSVQGFSRTFPDMNDVQLEAANLHGVKPVKDRVDAEHRKAELVYVGSNPFFHIDKLNNSIPYLVPRASVLLQDIGQAFFDSLQIKQIPLHKIIVTSVLRTEDDVRRLRNHNSNATENSCHLYATTFDICYNRYKTVEAPDAPRRQVRNDTLKWVLSEVLDDMRTAGRCYIKYEVKQGCFHITVR